MTESSFREHLNLGRFGIVKVWCLCGCFLVGSVMAARVGDHLGDIAQAVNEAHAVDQSFTYTTNNGTISIVKYTGPGGVVVVPGKINALPVTRIGDNAFYACTGLTGVTISNNVTSIGENAFRSCTALANVALPESLTSIGDGAFSCCISLARITLPNSVARIGDWVFSYCTGLVAITIPDSVTVIGGSAFHTCRSLVDVAFPSAVTNIGSMAFYSCSALETITISKRVAYIGDLAFSRCANLRVVYFKGNLPALGSSVLNGCGNATVYYLPETTGWGTVVAERPASRWMGPSDEAPVSDKPAVSAPSNPVMKKPVKGRRKRP